MYSQKNTNSEVVQLMFILHLYDKTITITLTIINHDY